MDEFFGVPVSSIALALGAVFAIAAGVLLFTAVRNPILVRLAVRNVPRRRAQSVLIVAGLMLATAIITSAFTIGDSISFSIRRSVIDNIRSLDQIVRVDKDSPAWEGKAIPDEFSAEVFDEVGPILEADPDIDGVLPVLTENVAVINLRERLFEVKAVITGLDPARTRGFGPLLDTGGIPVDLATLAPDQVYIDKKGAGRINAQVGDTLGVALRPGELAQLTVKGIADGWYVKRIDIDLVLMLPLARAQELLGEEGQLSFILVSNRGDDLRGERLTPAVQRRLASRTAIKEAGLELFPLKSDLIDLANDIASLFVTVFTTFGLFSIGVGILLIFLIFSMLAAERKSEMGISRAVGMQRRHLVRMFMAEGALYGLGAAMVGAAIGVGLGYLLVIGVASAFERGAPAEEFQLIPHVTPRSVLVSFFAGSVVTFVTVAFASRRASRLNIVRAIRDIPEPHLARAGRGSLIWGTILAASGVTIAFAGMGAAQLTAFGLGVSLVPIGLAMALRWKGVPQRWVLSAVGLFLLVFWLLPSSVFDAIKQDWKQDFSIFFVSGALVNTGAVLLAMNNSRLVLGAMTGTLGRVRRLAPLVKAAVSYPLRATFRTGMSVAMFAVVVFSIIVMSTVSSSFNRLFNDRERLAGGYQAIAFSHVDLNPVRDLAAEVEANPDLAFISRANGAPSVGAFRTIRNGEAQLSDGSSHPFRDSFITGVDDDFIASNRFGIKLATAEYATASGFDGAAVWRALRDNPGLAVVNASLVPTRNNFNFDVASDEFRMDVPGLYIENKSMEPVRVSLRDRKSGAAFGVTVIGVIDDIASFFFLPQGVFTSTHTFETYLPRQVPPTQLFFNVPPGTTDAAKRIEAAFFQHGMDTIDIGEEIDESRAANIAFNKLLVGFMALGLVVGIAALGVISARAVVERRHEIGVMRAIGFSRRMVQLSFLMESSFIALLGIGIGLSLGLLTSVNVVNDIANDEPNISLAIPWVRVVVIAAGAYLFSLLTTFLPSRQAAQVAPADALRYE